MVATPPTVNISATTTIISTTLPITLTTPGTITVTNYNNDCCYPSLTLPPLITMEITHIG